MEKYRTAGQATDGNMTHAHCMQDSQGYKRTHYEYAILFAVPHQPLLYERSSMLRYTYTARLLNFDPVWCFRNLWQWATLPTFSMNLLLLSSGTATMQVQSFGTTQCAVGYL